ncbi:hypothetical protein PHISCL_03635 [Aspergillus sclerotialis]|uniref:Uncharacterized protein n=1 Tax=Aspergillus sclerotialis TaxID=2070753 RepID=A0A3A3A3W1_9EURO|nr:hypothetical protein PHISCL_03635 [Aspergillus sclerotialis]
MPAQSMESHLALSLWLCGLLIGATGVAALDNLTLHPHPLIPSSASFSSFATRFSPSPTPSSASSSAAISHLFISSDHGPAGNTGVVASSSSCLSCLSCLSSLFTPFRSRERQVYKPRGLILSSVPHISRRGRRSYRLRNHSSDQSHTCRGGISFPVIYPVKSKTFDNSYSKLGSFEWAAAYSIKNRPWSCVWTNKGVCCSNYHACQGYFPSFGIAVFCGVDSHYPDRGLCIK